LATRVPHSIRRMSAVGGAALAVVLLSLPTAGSRTASAADATEDTAVSTTTTVDPENADLVAERERIKAAQEALDAQVAGLEADKTAVLAEMDRLDGELSAQSAAVEAAEAEVAAAASEVDEARQAESEAARQLEVRESTLTEREDAEQAQHQDLRRLAVDAYIHGPDVPAAVLGGGLSDIGKRRVLARTQLDLLNVALDGLIVAREAAAQARDRAEMVRGRAAETRAATEAAEEVARAAEVNQRDRLDQLVATYARHQALAEQLAAHLDEALVHSQELSAADAALVSELQRREAEAARRRAEQQARAAAEARLQALLGSRAAQAAAAAGQVQTTWVRGIEVNVAIAANLEAMMAAAEADGIYLTGSGYRSVADQIAIRAAVCGPTEYDIWVKPSWECSPPVARPGSSNHQLGLAIDFTLGGDLVRNSGDAIVQWLYANANRFGFYNLPSEPWHWSVDGH